MKKEENENISRVKVANLLTEIIVNNDREDFMNASGDEYFKETGRLIAMGKSWRGISDRMVDYALKYGEDTVEYVLKEIRRTADERIKELEKYSGEISDDSENS